MAEILNPNMIGFVSDDVGAVTSRNAEYDGSPLTDQGGDGTFDDPYLGANRAGSCSPGIGINTGDIDPKLDDWTVLDVNDAARDPQQGQHIGGDAFNPQANYPSSGGVEGSGYTNPIKAFQLPILDFNDVMSFSVADTAAAPDAVYDTGTNAVNKTGKTVAIGDRIWGPIPV